MPLRRYAVDCFLGIDLGTSSVKVVALDAAGKVVAAASRCYETTRPEPGYAEQSPELWWSATAACISDVLKTATEAKVRGIGLSGQMHGLICLDSKGHPCRDAIIWPDMRSSSICREWRERGFEKDFRFTTGLPIATGFLAPSLEWVKRNEPATYATISRVMLPKDYIRFRLTGSVVTDPSDAAGSYIFDIGRREWSREILDALGFEKKLFPEIAETLSVAGVVSDQAAGETGLAARTPVATGGSDQAMAALALGLDRPGNVEVAISTGGTILTPITSPLFDERMHTLCSAYKDKWFLMGAVLSGGSAIAWFMDNILNAENRIEGEAKKRSFDEIMDSAKTVPAGSEGLIFLPYLNGERTPLMDPSACGSFIGLRGHHTRAHMVRAIMEGVAFSMRASIEIFRGLGLPVDSVSSFGGGSKSPVWRQIISEVFGLPLKWRQFSDFSPVGAALCAAMAIGEHPAFSVDNSPAEISVPSPEHIAFYQDRIDLFKQSYTQLRCIFDALP